MLFEIFFFHTNLVVMITNTTKKNQIGAAALKWQMRGQTSVANGFYLYL